MNIWNKNTVDSCLVGEPIRAYGPPPLKGEELIPLPGLFLCLIILWSQVFPSCQEGWIAERDGEVLSLRWALYQTQNPLCFLLSTPNVNRKRDKL